MNNKRNSDGIIWLYAWPFKEKGRKKTLVIHGAQEFARASGIEDKRLAGEDLEDAWGIKAGGKPYLINLPEVCFSLSHSGEYLFCAYYSLPLGLDFQLHRKCNQRGIARRYFHPLEQGYLEKNSYRDFFAVWSAKESYVKYLGTGIAGGFGKFSVVDEKGLLTRVNDEVDGAGETGRTDETTRAENQIRLWSLPGDKGSLALCGRGFSGIKLANSLRADEMAAIFNKNWRDLFV